LRRWFWIPSMKSVSQSTLPRARCPLDHSRFEDLYGCMVCPRRLTVEGPRQSASRTTSTDAKEQALRWSIFQLYEDPCRSDDSSQ
jgi:hypothetical protein